MRTAPSAARETDVTQSPQASGLRALCGVPQSAAPVPCYSGTVTERPGSELPDSRDGVRTTTKVPENKRRLLLITP